MSGEMAERSSWRADPFRLVWLALPIFLLHVVEETLGGFVERLNGQVEPDATWPTFFAVNAICFVITALFAVAAARSRSPAELSATLGWLAMLMLSNGLFHIVATFHLGRYSPGTITAAGLYLPFFALLFARTIQRGALRLAPFLTVAALVGIPGAIHFYLIVFEGQRLL